MKVLAFIAGIDRILDMARTAVNVVGNTLAALVMAKWEKRFDEEKFADYQAENLKKAISIRKISLVQFSVRVELYFHL